MNLFGAPACSCNYLEESRPTVRLGGGLCYTSFHAIRLSEDRPLLSRMYVRRVRVFWHEEIAQLTS